jgi:uncharacterized protein YkwD
LAGKLLHDRIVLRRGRIMSNPPVTRRKAHAIVLRAAAALSLGLPLANCARIGEGASGHAGRRPAAGVKPLEFDPVAGLAAVNGARAKFLLGEFAADPRLQQAAQTHADLMASSGNFGHEFGPGTKFPARIAAVDFPGSAGENLGVGYGSIEEAIEGWLNSPKHREILLRRRYNRAGLAYAFNRSGRNPKFTHFWVLIVGEEAPGGVAAMRAG